MSGGANMLEFQESFFEQEVRDGFYLDTTMKTLWAAELEVLQKVAEICDRHGLKWYAAYGTLLGAIRHEGFVPWDDDMDIWVKRPDYNILMQVLPKELPEGYLVRSPMTDEGYNQYHTCLNSGNGISIAKEWLEQFHGCPFTVGLDIFPLDYLPRNEKDRELQATLLAMTGRIAQLAKNVGRGDYDAEEEKDKYHEPQGKRKKRNDRKAKRQSQKKSVIEEIRLGIDYLEKNCKLEIDHQLLEDENWEKLSSELWKWANYLAMMYSEDESDYIVEMFDYIQCPHKAYPKEWFADGYSATFENFMIPVPAGYHQILRYIYGLVGDYLVRKKKTGTHEYPFYARQLRQLRQYVKDLQQRAKDVGLVSIDQIEVKEDTKELPPEWVTVTLKEDSSRKKIILSANDPAVYVAYGDRALDKLEETLHTFERAKDSVLLWWRPQPVMRKMLDQVSPELGERYQGILDCYKESGWGICDETDNTDRAVEACDIYYGDMNAVIQPVQNAGKPVMLAVIEDREEWKRNAERFNEYRLFLSIPDFVEDNQYIYFANANYNALVVADKKTGKIVEYVPLEGYPGDNRNMHLRCVKLQDKIYFMPAGALCIHVYDTVSRTQNIYEFPGQKDKTDTATERGWRVLLQEDQVYLLPACGEQGLWRVRAQGYEPVKEEWWSIPSGDAILLHGVMDRNRFYTWQLNSGRFFLTDVAGWKVQDFELPDKNVQHVTYDGRHFWYTMKGMSDIVCWDSDQGIVDRYQVPYDDYYMLGYMDTYQGICFEEGHLFLLSGDGRVLYTLDFKKRELQVLHTMEYARGAFYAWELAPTFKRMGSSLICILQNAGEMLIIDLATLQVRQVRETFQADLPIKETVYRQSHKLLLDRKALVYEENGIADLNLLIQYIVAQ